MIFNEIKGHVNTSLGLVGGMHPPLCPRLDTTFCLNKLIAYEPPYMVTTNCLLKCRLSNRISFDVSDWCFCNVQTRACETLRSAAKSLGGLAITNLLGASC